MRRTDSRRARVKAALAALVVVLVGGRCDTLRPDAMVPIRPPASWREELSADRASKDAYFRGSPDSPLTPRGLQHFTRLEYFEPDPSYYFVGAIHVEPERKPFPIVTTSGKSRPCERFGWIEFELAGKPRRLEVYRLLDLGPGLSVDRLLLPFTDETSGRETYPAGRYVDLVGPSGELEVTRGADGRPRVAGPFVLDFNRAYNPSCAYGAPERFACPVTPKENRLALRVEAGERGYEQGSAPAEAGS